MDNATTRLDLELEHLREDWQERAEAAGLEPADGQRRLYVNWEGCRTRPDLERA